MRRVAVVCWSGKVVTAGHLLNWSTMTKKGRPSTSLMSKWRISNGLVAGWCFLSGSAGNELLRPVLAMKVINTCVCAFLRQLWIRERRKTIRGPYTNIPSLSSMVILWRTFQKGLSASGRFHFSFGKSSCIVVHKAVNIGSAELPLSPFQA